MEKSDLHRAYSDEAFEQAFDSGRFPAEAFTHQAHLRLAWVHLNRHGLDGALEQVCKQIRAFTVINGVPDKYHHTLTRAAVCLVWVAMRESGAAGFQELLQALPDLTGNFRQMLLRHYSEQRLFSKQAQTEFLEPDLLGFNC